MYTQTVELEHGTEVDLQRWDMDADPVFASYSVKLFGVDVIIADLPNDLAESIYDEAVTYARDDKWGKQDREYD